MSKYVVITEHKADGPIIMETYLKCADHEAARERMSAMIKDPGIIRACIARLVFEFGNEELLSRETPTKPMPF